MTEASQPAVGDTKPSRLMRIAGTAVNLLYGVGLGIAWALFHESLERIGLEPTGLIALFAMFTSLWLAIAIHEGGHFVAAIIAGMQPFQVRVLRIEGVRRRHGWSVRWSKSPYHPAGFVAAHPPLADDWRRCFLIFIAGGPLANLLVSAIAVVAAVWVQADAMRYALWATAAVHAAPALASLVPITECDHPTDGAQWLRWRRGIPVDDPSLAYLRLNAASLQGARADEFEQVDIDALERAPMPMRLIAHWLRLLAARNRFDWEAAARHSDAFEEGLRSIEEKQRAAWADLAALLRAEAAFCAAFATRDPAPLDAAQPLSARVRWYVPEMPPRLEALRKGLRGEAAGCLTALDDARRHSARSFDRGSERSCNLLYERIAASLGVQVPRPEIDSAVAPVDAVTISPRTSRTS